MDYKEKYEEALERCREFYLKLGNAKLKEEVEEIFPELNKSEDKKIRKFISHELACLRANDEKGSDRYEELTNAITWLEKQAEQTHVWNVEDEHNLNVALSYIKDEYLRRWFQDIVYEKFEKQGEQKPVDKTEAKFKVGDWITNNCAVWCIENIHNRLYDLKGQHGCVMKNLKSKTIDDKFHLWTIQDAKDGDVLCCENGWTCIFKKLNSDISFSSYCFMDKTGWFCEIGGVSHTLEEAFVKAYSGNTYPATREHCDLLFTKMKEAGYEWDAEKKELKKIEQEDDELTDFESALFSAFSDAWQEYLSGKTVNIAKWTREHSVELLEVAKKQSHFWSEEDEKHLLGCINYFSGITESSPYYNDFLWLKSLKERIKL